MTKEAADEDALEWATTHGKTVVAATVGIASAVFGTGYWLFYSALGVRPGEVGFGPAEILSQAAVGVVLLALAWLASAAAGALCYSLGRWLRAGWAKLRRQVLPPAPFPTADLVANGLATAAVVSIAVVAGLVVEVVVSSWDPGWVGFVALGLLGIVPLADGWKARAAGTAEAPTTGLEGRVAKAAVVVFAVAIVPLTWATAFDSARVVRSGLEPDSRLHRLVGGPVQCVRVQWRTDPPARVGADIGVLLGEAGGRIVVYLPGRGPLRLPAEDVVADPLRRAVCRPSP